MTLAAVGSELNSETSPETITKIILVVEYEGTHYHGFQAQEDLPTVQVALEEAIRKLTGEELRVICASRTDAGVHALGQVVTFRTRSNHPMETYVSGLNYHLPDDISVKSAHRATEEFAIWGDAVSREYDYYILNSRTRSPLKKGFYHRVPGELDIEAMNQACQVMLGEHDFASFVSPAEAARKNTVKTVYKAEVRQEGEMVVVKMAANSFLMHQVRNTVGPLIEVGRGRMSVSEFCRLLEAGQPGLARPAAPACGLFLMAVDYKNPFGED